MGRYIRKSKPVDELVLMEVAQSSSLGGGVRTRAKTLALERLQKLSAAAVAVTAEDSTVTPGEESYLQLRNRRLAKPPIPVADSKRRRKIYLSNSSPSSNFIQPKDSESKSDYIIMGEKKSGSEKVEQVGKTEVKEEIGGKENGDFSIEASFGENILEIDGKERGTRESTPISLIRDPQMVTTPGSTTRPPRLGLTNSMDSNRMQVPTSEELDLFFGESEKRQERQFKEKYNFDPAKDEPLPGRFKWEKPDL